jgi:hypothetical protein
LDQIFAYSYSEGGDVVRRLIKVAFTLLLCGVLWSFVPAGAEAVTLTSPNGGESWLVGSKQNITWSPNDTTLDYILEYSTDSGVTWNLIYQGAARGFYEWTVPDTPSTKARVRVKQWVKEFNYILGTDVSDADFTIISKLEWTLTPILLPPAAPAYLKAETWSSSAILLYWQDKSVDESGFKVYRRYGSYAYTLIKTLPANTTSYMDDTGLLSNTQYTYKVQSYNAVGASDSNEASETTWKQGLDAPLRATAASPSSISLTWRNVTHYHEWSFRIFRKYGNGTYTLINTVADYITSYLDTGLLPNTQYTYKVQAYGWPGDNIDYNEASATTYPLESAAPTVIRFYVGSTNYYVNDAVAGMDVSPIIRDGRTLIPIRYVADPLGADIIFDSGTGKATISLGNNVVELWINNNTARVNGVAKLIDPLNPNVTAVTLPPGRIVLPLRFVAESLGCEVKWTAATKEVKITYTPPFGGGGGSIL